MNKLIVVHAIKSLYVVAGYVKIRGKKEEVMKLLILDHHPVLVNAITSF
jgi:hypothetical protein